MWLSEHAPASFAALRPGTSQEEIAETSGLFLDTGQRHGAK
ncbi:hypothetical protein [Streptomyces sporangiiformans]|nr:hypothetical protein [Streptomyces sporangiiformans]